ncbi:transducin beta-like protein 3 [Condylostylus longicornis]|uniref:transducin beta-like protein 3 n=1 Tax=Condylostylus longicornis TaxID=2530218 RepID=UPI00244E3FB5|nr:transducin beta-like protein 3 [Condylostylus longicornis]
MAVHIKMKEVFEVESNFGAFFTSGTICWSKDGKEIFCQNSAEINVINVDNGKIVKKITQQEIEGLEEDIIYTFALSSDDEHILTAHRSGLLKLWSRKGEQIKMWKGSHKGPISKVVFRSRSSIIATGGSDSSIRVWDYDKKSCLISFRDSVGVISVLEFHPDLEKTQIFAAGDDYKINCWDYSQKVLLATFSGHFSKVTDLSFTYDFKNLVSVGRDKVLILWNLETKEKVRVIPIYETLEGVKILQNNIKLPNGFDLGEEKNLNKIFVAVAGEGGAIQIWECTESKIIFMQVNSCISKAKEEGSLAITQLLYCPVTNQLCVVSIDHNIIIHNIPTFHCAKQLIGFSDEILDVCFVGKKSKYLAVATNSSDIKFYDTCNMNCQILKGHSDIVLSLASYKNLLLSSAKDNSIRIWEVNTGNFSVRCVAKGIKHTASVGSVTFGKISHTKCASVSQDTCLKVWEVPKSFEEDNVISLTCLNTVIAHEKDINCVAISPNDRLIATASQDKTAKLWSVDDLQLLGTLRGHKRGVWCVRFSPVDQVILSTSADCTVRLWSVSDMSCLKSFEGHESSVLCADFLNRGLQFLSAGADGLIKLWTIKNNECNGTFEKHESRIWALAVHPDETHFFSGGSDSCLIKWNDVTEEKKIAEFNAQQEIVLQEQELNNLLVQKKTLKALKLALKLEKPFLTLKIINEIMKNKEMGLDETVLSLNDLHKENLLKHAITWNTNSKNCRAAQLILNILLKEILANKFKVTGLEKMVEEALPYTERHFRRVTEYLKDLKFIEFTLKCMQPYGKMEVDESDSN